MRDMLVHENNKTKIMNIEFPQPETPTVQTERNVQQVAQLPNAVEEFPANPIEGAVYFTPPMTQRGGEEWRALPSDERERQLERRLALKDATGQAMGRAYQQQRETTEEYRKAAETDALTELPNYRVLIDDVKKAVEVENSGTNNDPSKTRLFLLNIDIDKFKQVNDTRGHDVGDITLKAFAKLGNEVVEEAIEQLELRAGAKLYRKSGDEFYVLGCADITENNRRHTETPEQQVELLVQRIKAAVDRELEDIKNLVPGFGVSIGHVLHEPGEGAESFLKRSDGEMYKQKDGKREQAAGEGAA